MRGEGIGGHAPERAEALLGHATWSGKALFRWARYLGVTLRVEGVWTPGPGELVIVQRSAIHRTESLGFRASAGIEVPVF